RDARTGYFAAAGVSRRGGGHRHLRRPSGPRRVAQLYGTPCRRSTPGPPRERRTRGTNEDRGCEMNAYAPLAGVKVLDLGILVPAALTSGRLAGLGADVV